MMVESALDELSKGTYEFAVEYLIAVTAVDEGSVRAQTALIDVALSLLSNPRLTTRLVSEQRAETLRRELRSKNEEICSDYTAQEISQYLISKPEKRILTTLSRDFQG